MKNMKNHELNVQSSAPSNHKDKVLQITEKLRKEARLKPEDQSKFAFNLGAMAKALNSRKPKAAVKKILLAAGRDELFQKRKRYFRFPGEADGSTFNSNPSVFISLAEEIGRIRANNADPEVVKREQNNSLRQLYAGSTYMPDYIPANAADISAAELLKDYSTTLSEALKERTAIGELWKLLKDTPIDVSTKVDNAMARQTPQKFHNLFASWLNSEQSFFEPDQSKYNLPLFWAYPEVLLGHHIFSLPIKVFMLPKNLRPNLKAEKSSRSSSYVIDYDKDEEVWAWLSKIGLFKSHSLPDHDFREYGYGWKSATVHMLISVNLKLKEALNGDPEIYLRFDFDTYNDPIMNWEIPSQFISIDNDRNSYVRNENFERNISDNWHITQVCANSYHAGEKSDGDGDWIPFNIIYENAFNQTVSESSGDALAIVPENWMHGGEYQQVIENLNEPDVLGCLYTKSWVEDESVANILLGNIDAPFIPSFPQSDPIGGIFRQGCLAASLWNNLREASGENSVTNLIIERAKIIADSGIGYYEELLREYKEAVKNI